MDTLNMFFALKNCLPYGHESYKEGLYHIYYYSTLYTLAMGLTKVYRIFRFREPTLYLQYLIQLWSKNTSQTLVSVKVWLVRLGVSYSNSRKPIVCIWESVFDGLFSGLHTRYSSVIVAMRNQLGKVSTTCGSSWLVAVWKHWYYIFPQETIFFIFFPI